MNWENLPEKRMSRWGIGPVFAALSIGYGMMTLLMGRYFHPVFQISFVPYSYLAILGVILILIGVPFWITAVLTVMRAYNANELVTGGVYRCCRHPVYSSWVVFIVPGIALLVSSWLGLTTPIFMYFILRVLVKREEAYLENLFGSKYVEYKKRIPCILPIGWLRSIE
jgi:protein-S-isoprenylcysteine O-methyltransferase Ste14